MNKNIPSKPTIKYCWICDKRFKLKSVHDGRFQKHLEKCKKKFDQKQFREE